MINWNFDIEAAKPEGWVLICVDDKSRWVGMSCWLPDEKRWNMIATDQVPHAWSPVNHPLSDTPYTAREALKTPVATLPPGMIIQ